MQYQIVGGSMGNQETNPSGVHSAAIIYGAEHYIINVVILVLLAALFAGLLALWSLSSPQVSLLFDTSNAFVSVPAAGLFFATVTLLLMHATKGRGIHLPFLNEGLDLPEQMDAFFFALPNWVLGATMGVALILMVTGTLMGCNAPPITIEVNSEKMVPTTGLIPEMVMSTNTSLLVSAKSRGSVDELNCQWYNYGDPVYRIVEPHECETQVILGKAVGHAVVVLDTTKGICPSRTIKALLLETK
jgi:hypothetical protein